jgi:hypothetical protein
MTHTRWEVVETVSGDLQAELLRGLLEAQGVEVVLSQEGAGHSVYPVTVGKLGEVDILVPVEQIQQAIEILAAYRAGDFENNEEQPSEGIEEGPGSKDPDVNNLSN